MAGGFRAATGAFVPPPEATTGDSRRARFELWAVLDGRCRSPWAHGQERKVPLLALTCRALAERSFWGRHWGAEK